MIVDQQFRYDDFKEATLDAKAKGLVVVAVWTGTHWKIGIKDSPKLPLHVGMRNKLKTALTYVFRGYDSTFRKKVMNQPEVSVPAADKSTTTSQDAVKPKKIEVTENKPQETGVTEHATWT